MIAAVFFVSRCCVQVHPQWSMI